MAQTILVTGSSSGFGRLIVEILARQGYTVFAGMRAVAGKNAPAAEELRALAQREQLAVHIVEIDVTDDTSVEQAIASLVGITGRLDVVVNNAGIAYGGPLEAFTLEQAQQQFDTNVFGVLRVNRAALPHMRRQGSGLLLQIGSIAGRLALPFQGLYAATKFALEALTESYRDELAPFGIDAAI
ncbi:MAG TPA: SDR family oxidoreductase, partial [Ktedonobacteraceae bacterium]